MLRHLSLEAYCYAYRYVAAVSSTFSESSTTSRTLRL